MASKLLLLAGATVVALAVAESALRWFGIGGMIVFTPHADWGYLMTPSQTVRVYGHPIAINTWGLRGPEVRAPKTPGSTRLLFVGDSIAYGGGRIREEQLFVRRVESAVRGLGVDAEALNLSAPAWSPQNWARYLDARGLLDADLLVIVLPECDLARPFATLESGGHHIEAPWLRMGSLAVKVQQVLASRMPVLSAEEPALSGNVPLSRARQDEIVAANVDAIRRVRDRARGLPVVTVLIPSAFPDSAQFWPLFEAGAGDVLDLRRELDDPSFFMDGVHLNVRGHEIVGQRLLARLRFLLATRATAYFPRSRVAPRGG